jgi:hypothetical protein
MKQTLPNFSKKVVSFSFAGADNSQCIAHPRWETQGGRLFLIGTVPRGGSTHDWCEGVVSAVAWDQVSDYLVFDSVEDYRVRLKIYERRKRRAYLAMRRSEPAHRALVAIAEPCHRHR